MAISITKPTINGSANNWGQLLNDALDEIVTEVNAQDGDDWVTTARIDDGAVTAAKIGDAVVTTAKIAGSAVTAAKIGSDAVTTAKIADDAVTGAKLDPDRRDGSSSVDVRTGNAHDYIHFDANVGMRFFTNNAEDMRLTDAGTLHVDGDIVAYSSTISDRNLKTNIEPMTGALEKVQALNGYTFTYRHDGRESAGVIAQEVQQVIPTAVTLQEDGIRDTGYLTVQYDQLHAVLIEAIKELKAKVEALENGG